MIRPVLQTALCLLWLTLALQAAAAPPDQAGLDLFERNIRPVLVEHCYRCHSAGAKQLRGGLRLDHREGLLQGGDSGPAIVPGKPGESLLVRALRHEELEMPPDGKLPRAVIDDFVKWIELGAADPRDEAAAPAPSIDVETGRAYWAFQPPQFVEPPPVADAAWPRGTIDRYILAALEKRGLQPAGDASPRQLVRRLYFDLLGLPPEPKDVEAFLADDSPSALEHLVDRLLGSPHFGERWGRHWLDVARYADSTGGGRTKALENAWRYRDYVIDAFNRDKPYDRFLAEQIAGDLLSGGSTSDNGLKQRRDALVATGFLVLGPTNYETQDKELLRMDVIDEQIDTLGKAVLGLTLGCARCHDHKFDPIPTRDYYALAGIFRSTKTLTPGNVSGFVERPLPVEGPQKLALDKHRQAVDALAMQIAQAKNRVKELKAAGATSGGSAGPVAPAQLVGIVVDDTQAEQIGQWKSSTYHPRYVGQSYIHDDNSGKGQKTVIFVPDLPAAGEYEVRLASTPGGNRDTKTPVTIHHAQGEQTIEVDQRGTPPIEGLFVSLGRFRFEAGRAGSVTVSNAGTKAHVIADAVQFIPADLLDKAGSPVPSTRGATADPKAEPDATAALAAQLKEAEAQVKSLDKQLAELKKSGPQVPMAMAVEEEAKPGDWHIHIHGGVRSLGPIVPRGFLSVLSADRPPAIALGQSGRRELALWIASADNPLTARVLVNRAWHYLFGAGLVRTVDNFGQMGERPSHPELLDYLALRLVDRGWSVKQLLREIVLSRTYRQSTAARPQALTADPQNRLLGRMNRRRLDAESLRDAMLAVSGQLDLSLGGPALRATETKNDKIEYRYQFTTTRRSVYVPIFRNRLLELFEVFDFADPNLVTGCRTCTTLPTQALFLMNSPFVMDQAQHAAERTLALPDLDEPGRVELAYQRALGRPPTSAERALALQYLQEVQSDRQAAQPDAARRLAAWAGLYQAFLSSIDFRYLD